MDERTQAIIETLQYQRNLMADREAQAQGEIAVLNSQIKLLNSKIGELMGKITELEKPELPLAT